MLACTHRYRRLRSIGPVGTAGLPGSLWSGGPGSISQSVRHEMCGRASTPR